MRGRLRGSKEVAHLNLVFRPSRRRKKLTTAPLTQYCILHMLRCSFHRLKHRQQQPFNINSIAPPDVYLGPIRKEMTWDHGSMDDTLRNEAQTCVTLFKNSACATTKSLITFQILVVIRNFQKDSAAITVYHTGVLRLVWFELLVPMKRYEM